MKNILKWVMAGRVNALLAVACLSLLPMFGWAVNGLLALVILRMGLVEGVLVYFAGLIPLVLISTFGAQANDLKIIVFTLTFLAALFLGDSRRLFLVLVGLSIGSLMLYFMLVTQEWSQISQSKSEMVDTLLKAQTQEYSLLNGQNFKFTPESVGNLVDQLLVHLIMINALLGLLLGRWWQAILYNPGGFQREFHNLEAPKLLVGLFALSPVVLNALFNTSIAPWVVAIQVPLLLLGVSLVHFWAKKKQLVSGWLVLFYITLPWTSPLVIMLGVADTFFGIKKKLQSDLNES